MLSPYTAPRISQVRRTRLVTGPLCAPISTQDFQTYLKMQVDGSRPDMLNRIKSATTSVEKYLSQSLVAQTWDMFIDGDQQPFPTIFYQGAYQALLTEDRPLELARSPLLSFIGAYVTDETGTETTIDPDTYWISGATSPARIMLRQGCIWPYYRAFEGFRARFISGYVFPFTVTGGVVTAPNHTLLEGQIVRVQHGQDVLPDGLEEDTDYTAVGVSQNTLSLADATGELVTIGDQSFYSFLGEVPPHIRHAIALTAVAQLNTAPGESFSGSPNISLPPPARELLASSRQMFI